MVQFDVVQLDVVKLSDVQFGDFLWIACNLTVQLDDEWHRAMC